MTGKDLDGNDFELGKAIAAATEDGVWVDYMWLHPTALRDAPKTAYAVRHDGLLSHLSFPHLVGTAPEVMADYLAAIDAGEWIELPYRATRAAGEVIKRSWGVQHDGLYFWSGYFVER